MKKIYLLLLAFSLASSSYSQTDKVVNGDTINKTDAKKYKQGYWEETNNNNLSKGCYINDKKDGAWITYSAKGMPNKVESFKGGLKNGVSISIDDNGYYKGEANYKNDVLNGSQRIYATGGRLLSDANYKNGILEGTKKTYYENNNKIQEESFYLNGERDGVSKWYDTDGKLIAEYNYKNGKFEGINKTYYKSGNVQSEEIYVKNLRNGVYKEYFDTTIVSKTTDLEIKTNKPVDPSEGTRILKLKGNYKNDMKDGKWIEYNENGTVLKTTTYIDGVEKK